MPLTTYTCGIVGGCDVRIPGNDTPTHYGITGGAVRSLGPALAIPTMTVAPGAIPGDGALRISASGHTWYVWAAEDSTFWVDGATPGQQFQGPNPRTSLQANLSTADLQVHFSVSVSVS